MIRSQIGKRFYTKGVAPFQQPHFIQGSSKVAVYDTLGSHTFKDINDQSSKVSQALRQVLSKENRNSNVSFLTPNNSHYTLAQFGIWKSGFSSVPLCNSHPAQTLKYYLEDSQASALIINQDNYQKVKGLPIKNLLVLEELLQENHDNQDDDAITDNDNAMIIYTSGTTGSPKGVVLTLANLISQIECMIVPWGWTEQDHILHVLPLHHTHGIVNCLLCPLHVGASISMLSQFDAQKVWQLLTDEHSKINIFMGVPTIYSKLLQSLKSNPMLLQNQNLKSILSKKIRLMVSGSAALPQPVFEDWKHFTGHTLLERYGMTEIGMALSNSLNANQRKPGYVGLPLPNVQARIVNEGQVLVEANDQKVLELRPDQAEELAGDLQIKGSNVFKGYYNRPEATEKEFTDDNWFKTGDTAQFQDNAFKILGRSSVDIIKSGGYKISALHVERLLLSHPAISDVAVVGIEDEVYGQKLAAIIVLAENEDNLTLEDLKHWAVEKMPKYLIPSSLKLMQELPKNHMGKVNKKELVKLAFPADK